MNGEEPWGEHMGEQLDDTLPLNHHSIVVYVCLLH